MEWLEAISKFIGNVGFPIALIVLLVMGFLKMAPELARLIEAHIKLVQTLDKSIVGVEETLKRMEANDEKREAVFTALLEYLKREVDSK